MRKQTQFFSSNLWLAAALLASCLSASQVYGFNNDGRTDIVWHHDITGQNYPWFMREKVGLPSGPIGTGAINYANSALLGRLSLSNT